MKEDIIFQRRNRLKNHFTNTSNVLLWCYKTLSDAARRLYQILDGFDYVDKELGTSKGYVFPGMTCLVKIMGKDESSVRRYLRELIAVKLITRKRRRNQSSVFIIEDISEEQIQAYYQLRNDVFNSGNSRQGGGGASAATAPKNGKPKIDSEPNKPRTGKYTRSREASEQANMPVAYKEEKELKNKNSLTLKNESSQTLQNQNPPPNLQTSRAPSGMTSMGELLKKHQPSPSPQPHLTLAKSDDEAIMRRDALANELAEKLHDRQGLGCYRNLASKLPHQVLYEILSETKQMQSEGKINTKPGAYFVYKIKQYAKEKGIVLDFAPT